MLVRTLQSGLTAWGRNGRHLPAATATREPLGLKAVILDPRLFWGDATFSASGHFRHPDREEVNGRAAYAAAALAYICINYRARKFAEAPLIVAEQTDEGDEWLEDHPLAGLLARPAPDMPMRRLLMLSSILRDTTGACLWYKVRTRGSQLMQLRPFGKEDFTVEAEGDRWWALFRITAVRGPEIRATWRDCVYFVNVDPEFPITGAVAPLDAALNMLNLGESVRVQARNLVRKAVRPTGVFSTDQLLTDAQYERAREQINQRVQGPQNAGEWLLMEGGAKWEQISQAVSDVLPKELVAWIEATVCACFGLHPSVLGIKSGIENSPWSNLKEATKNTYEETILPRHAEDQELLTDQLLRDVDRDEAHFIKFDTTEIPALQEDLETRIDKFRHAFPYLRVDEVRQLLDYLPLGGPAGDQRYVPVNWMVADMLEAEPNVPQLPPADAEEPSAPATEPNEAERTAART